MRPFFCNINVSHFSVGLYYLLKYMEVLFKDRELLSFLLVFTLVVVQAVWPIAGRKIVREEVVNNGCNTAFTLYSSTQLAVTGQLLREDRLLFTDQQQRDRLKQ